MTPDQFDTLAELLEDLIKTQIIKNTILASPKEGMYVPSTISGDLAKLNRKYMSK